MAAECMGWVSARRFRKGQGGSGSSGKKKPGSELGSGGGDSNLTSLAFRVLPYLLGHRHTVSSLLCIRVALVTHFVSHIYFLVFPAGLGTLFCPVCLCVLGM